MSRASFTHMSERGVKDFKHLEKVILAKLIELEKSLLQSYARETLSSVKWSGSTPYQQIMDRLWGCPGQCPFCAEPCSDATANHYPPACHKCVQHRPRGIGGLRKIDTQKFVIDTCSFGIQSSDTFACSVGDYACRKSGACSTKGGNVAYHPYRKYKSYFPEWDIAPNPANNTSKYWMWFVAKYQRELREEYKVLLEVPTTWKNVSKAEAVASLRENL